MYNKKTIALFKNWDEAMIWSCLQGYMGTLIADDETNPTSAVITNGDFSFCAGLPNEKLLKSLTIRDFMLIASNNDGWFPIIELVYGEKAKKILRYAIKKESDVFNIEKLKLFVDFLDNEYELRMFDEEAYELAKKESWSADLCSQFESYEDYRKRGIGAVILHNGKLVSGASPYAVYQSGIEIEIDTKPEYRGKGLATVCGAKLILECLSRNIYPSWDAHDLRSVHLAEKLGYHLSHPYVTYEIVNGKK